MTHSTIETSATGGFHSSAEIFRATTVAVEKWARKDRRIFVELADGTVYNNRDCEVPAFLLRAEPSVFDKIVRFVMIITESWEGY